MDRDFESTQMVVMTAATQSDIVIHLMGRYKTMQKIADKQKLCNPVFQRISRFFGEQSSSMVNESGSAYKIPNDGVQVTRNK